MDTKHLRLIVRQDIGQAAFQREGKVKYSDQPTKMVDEKGSHSQAMLSDIFAGYQNPPLTGDVAMASKAWQIWKSAPFSWFALWCATAGGGVSFEDHLQAEKHPLLASLHRFHVYYTTRRLLEELSVALPGDKSHSWYENPYNSRVYKRLCPEFGVSPNVLSTADGSVDHD